MESPLAMFVFILGVFGELCTGWRGAPPGGTGGLYNFEAGRWPAMESMGGGVLVLCRFLRSQPPNAGSGG